VKQHH